MGDVRAVLSDRMADRWRGSLVAGCLAVASAAGLLQAEEPQPYPNMATDVGVIVAEDYYDPSRIRPEVMVREALRTLESSDVAIDADWAPPALTIRVAEHSITFPAPIPGTLSEATVILEQVRVAIRHDRFDPEEQRNLEYAMMNGALQSLDPHTVIFAPEPADIFAEEIEGEFFGIGAYLNQKDGLIRIERVMPGLPADMAGVEDGDVILGVDGEKTTGLSLSQTVRRIKGPKGTDVRLTVERAGLADPVDIVVTRDRVQIIDMQSFRHGDIGYVRMDEFNRHTAQNLFHNLLELQRNGPIKGFVLDLRFNSGGLLTQAKLISDFFLTGKHEIVRTVSPSKQGAPFLSSDRVLCDVPVAVLVSSGSASAAEILAGALQLNGRAVVVGSPTFGKGSVQTIMELADNSNLKITIQEYQLAHGVSIQEHGVVPDIALVRHGTAEDGTVDVIPYSMHREGDSDYALRDHGTYTIEPTYYLGWLEPWLTEEDRRLSTLSSSDFRPDLQAKMVIDLIAQAVAELDEAAVEEALSQDQLRSVMLERLAEPVAQRAAQEADALAAVLLERFGLTWGEATPVQDHVLTGSYLGPQELMPGDTVEMRFAIENASDKAVGRLCGVVRSDAASPFWESEVLFGEVPAGDSTEGILKFAVPPRLYAGTESFELVIYQEGAPERELAVIPVQVSILERPRPSLSYRWSMREDGVLSVDETVTVQIHIDNQGDLASEAVLLYVLKDDDHFVQLGEARFRVPAIPAGASQSVDLPITLKGTVKSGKRNLEFDSDKIRLQIRAEEDFGDPRIDSRFRATLLDSLEIPVGQPVTAQVVEQPRIRITDIQRPQANGAAISFAVEDDNLDLVAVFVGEDKVNLVTADQLSAEGLHTVDIELAADEVTNVRLVASDRDEVMEVRTLRLFPSADALAAASQQAEVISAEPEIAIP